MSKPDFAREVEAVEGWIDALLRHLDWSNRQRAWLALVAVLHALRDSIGRDEAVYLGAELPPLLRGFFYDGWHQNARRPISRADFLERIRDGLRHDIGIDAELAARAVMLELSRRMPPSELEDAMAATPKDIHGLWPSLS